MEKIATSIIFLTMYSFSLFFVYIAQKSVRRRKQFICCSLIAVLIPSIFAALRAETVGTDVLVYARPMFDLAKNASGFMDYLARTDMEVGYSFLVYYVSKIFNNFPFVLFHIALLQIIPIYIVAYKLRNKLPMVIVMSVYFSMFYIMGFNIMRQCIAASFILLAMIELYEKKTKSAIICIVIAFLFHSSSAIGVIIVICAQCLLKIKNNKLRATFIVVMTVVAYFIMLRWEEIIIFLIKHGILSNRINYYVLVFNGQVTTRNQYMFKLGIDIWADFFFRILLFVIPFLLYCNRKKTQEANFIFSVVSIGTIIYFLFFLIFKSGYGYRITMYADIFMLLWVPLAFEKKNSVVSSSNQIEKRYKISVAQLLCILLFFSYWLIEYMYIGWHGVLPFEFI